jgi:hypothetical protein
MPPDDDPIIPTGDPPPAAGDPAALTGGLSPDAIRSSPEYKELQRQNRELSRQAGAATREASTARAAAEVARQAAEAQQQADLEAELVTALGEDGLAAYNEIAELSTTDPRAAARKMAALIAQARAQSQPVGGAPPTAPASPAPTVPVEGNVPSTAPPTPRGVAADAPLAPVALPDEYAQVAADLEARYAATVERVQDPTTRNRVTMKDRANAMIAYIGAAVLKGGARPKPGA